MRTARDEILARARQQRSRIRVLLQRHALTLRLAGESAPFRSVGDRITAWHDEAPRRRFYRPVLLSSPVETAPPFAPLPEGARRGVSEQHIAPEGVVEEPVAFTEAAADLLPALPPLPAGKTSARAEGVSVKDATPKEERLPPASPKPAPLTAQTQLEQIKAMMGKASRPTQSSGTPPGKSAPIAETPKVAVETVSPPRGRRPRRFEEVKPDAPREPQREESRDEATVTAATEPSEAIPPQGETLPPLPVAPSVPAGSVPEAAEIFSPVAATQSRTPAAWLARLKRASAPAPPRPEPSVKPAAIASSQTVSAPLAIPPGIPTPVSQTARRVLRPLVGIDPADVPVYRGTEAREAAQALNADAFALGNEAIVLGQAAEIAGEDAPETLGLLAHELTHIAQARTPRFVPPILATSSRNAVAQPMLQTEMSRSVAAPEFLSVAETPERNEAIAQQVESRVRRYVATRPTNAAVERVPAAIQTNPPGQDTPVAPVTIPATAANTEDWNGLPAPWEPLPAFISTPAVPSFGSVASSGSVPTEASTIQRAPVDRDLSETVPSKQAASPPEALPPAVPAPDLDALARQVYDKLKRRLAAEQRQRLR